MNRALNTGLLLAAFGFLVYLGISAFAGGRATDPKGPPRPDPLHGNGAGGSRNEDDGGPTGRGGQRVGGARGTSSDDPPLDLSTVRALLQVPEYSEALRGLDRILEKDPRNLEALTMRGRAHGGIGFWRKAELDFRGAIEIGGENVDRLVHLGTALVRIRKSSEAEKVLAQAAALDETDARAHAQMAKMHFDFGWMGRLPIGRRREDESMQFLETKFAVHKKASQPVQ